MLLGATAHAANRADDHTVCVPAFFQDHAKLNGTLGKRKARGAIRSDMNLHNQMFVPAAAKTDTSLTRSMALQYAALARVCDVQYGSTDTNLFLTMSGLILPRECDIKTLFMLNQPTMTPKGALLTACTDAMMQVQTAARLGRLPSLCSVLICITRSELQCLEQYTGTTIETPCISAAQLSTAVELTGDSISKAVVLFVSILWYSKGCEVFVESWRAAVSFGAKFDQCPASNQFSTVLEPCTILCLSLFISYLMASTSYIRYKLRACCAVPNKTVSHFDDRVLHMRAYRFRLGISRLKTRA
jgi:hypothetical protein